jgi:type II secretory ATPase GspE/PulE/Tfp pilus assembly ATPase PilB-like protein
MALSYRVAGEMQTRFDIPMRAGDPYLLARYKFMAGLDPLVSSRPQRGTIHFRHRNQDEPVRLGLRCVSRPGELCERALLVLAGG